jgi:hypothetical protein
MTLDGLTAITKLDRIPFTRMKSAQSLDRRRAAWSFHGVATAIFPARASIRSD